MFTERERPTTLATPPQYLKKSNKGKSKHNQVTKIISLFDQVSTPAMQKSTGRAIVNKYITTTTMNHRDLLIEDNKAFQNNQHLNIRSCAVRIVAFFKYIYTLSIGLILIFR